MVKDPTRNEVEAWTRFPSAVVKQARSISMLGEPALSLLEKLAARTERPIIELGPYIGGSTIALAAGCRDKVITVELGGPSLRDDHLSSSDILVDLRRNLHDADVANRVSIVEGHFRAATVFGHVERELGGSRAGLLFIDVYPGTELALCLYARLLCDDAFVVIDDYRSETAIDQAAMVSRFIETLVSKGILDEIGVFGWGTWFGKLAGADARRALRSQRAPIPCVLESGLCWHVYAGFEPLSDDKSGNGSPLLLFEDGEKLGPPHSLHADIRSHGGGRFSHWDGNLWFSTSDGTDPRFNKRRYTIRIEDQEIDLAAPDPLATDVAQQKSMAQSSNSATA